MNYILTAVLMMALWFIMSGKTEPKFLIIGAASSLIIAALCLRTLTLHGIRTDNQYYIFNVNIVKYLIYMLWLLKEIIKSAVAVSVITTVRKSDVEPSIAWFKADYDNPSARAMLANSITLTPGTITIDITEDGIFSVHALTRDIRDGLLDGTMQAKVAWLFGETIDFHPVEPKDIRTKSQTAIESEQPLNVIKGRRKKA
ncbi:MAG: Na+/H+ antiporter subunit E [Mogibacterium sp.]|nr:Na+/H+ antiporter subunit E [Mogibacterium sp.]